MRVSTGMIYDSGLGAIQKRTGSLLHTQQQVSSGKRVLVPSDDPVSAARALEVQQSQAVNDAQTKNRDAAKNQLGLADNQLQSATDLMTRLHQLAVQAGNASLTDSDRKSVSAELRQRFSELLGIANAADGSGQALFGGYQSSSKPFAGSVEHGVSYIGDDGQQALQVGSARQIAVATSGSQIFMKVKSGNGTFATGIQSEKSINLHTATITSATVTDANAWNDPINSGNLQLKFWVDKTGAVAPANEPGAVYYDVVDVATGNSLLTGAAAATSAQAGMPRYQDGAIIDLTNFDAAYANPSANPAGTADFGARVTLSGIPADGDTFTLQRPADGQIATTATSVGTMHSGVTIDGGTVTNPALWQQSANSGKLELRFWVDNLGGVQTPGNAVGSAAPTYPYTVDAGINDQFDIMIDGVGPATATVTGGPYATPAALAAAVQSAVDNSAFGPGFATVGFDKSNRLVITSSTSGAGSAINLAATPGNAGLTSLFGTAGTTEMAGATSTPGSVFYDLVDASTGKSLFTNTASTSGVGGTYTHPYTSNAAIPLASSLSPAFDLGASVTVTGTPASGDAFTIASNSDASLGNGYFTTAEKKAAAANLGAGIVGSGSVVDPSKWNSIANSKQLEVRFWKDTNVSPTKTYYDLVDARTGKSLLTDTLSTAGGAASTYLREFKTGDSISFSGLAAAYSDFGVTVSIDGQPETGDVFTLDKSQSISIFDNVANLIKALESSPAPVGATSANAQLQNQVGFFLTNLMQSEDSLTTARATIGSNLSEVDSLDTVGQNLSLQLSQTLSSLQDLDYAQAITDLLKQQMELQAAQKSFQMVSQLSLFNYLQ